jgi:hypothetical protein
VSLLAKTAREDAATAIDPRNLRLFIVISARPRPRALLTRNGSTGSFDGRRSSDRRAVDLPAPSVLHNAPGRRASGLLDAKRDFRSGGSVDLRRAPGTARISLALESSSQFARIVPSFCRIDGPCCLRQLEAK